MKQFTKQDQRGVAGIELALLVLVLAVAGFVVYRTVIARNTATNKNTSTKVTQSTEANGKVENTKAELEKTAANEATSAETFDESDTTNNGTAEEGMGDSINVTF